MHFSPHSLHSSIIESDDHKAEVSGKFQRIAEKQQKLIEQVSAF